MIFGDSLTRGADPGQHRRHAFEDRWPNILADGLGAGVNVIAEGLGGRTTIYDAPDGSGDRNGAKVLPMLIASHCPIDLLIIMLGSNDLKPEACGKAEGVVTGMDKLLDICEVCQPGVSVLVVSPPAFVGSGNHGGQPRGGRSIEESRRLGPMLRELSNRRGAAFFDASLVVRSSPIDGVHLDSDNTRALGLALVPVVRELMARQD